VNDLRYIEGKNPVKEALKSSVNIHEVYISNESRDKNINEIIAMCKEKGILFKFVDKNKLNKMSNTKNPQGVIALASEFEFCDVDDILNEAERLNEKPFILILDNITDPQNFGAILRSAHLTGVHGVIIEKRNSSPITPIVEKSSAGALEFVNIARVTNLNRTIELLKQKGLWIYAMDSQANKHVYECEFNDPIGVIIGSEGKGISRLLLEHADFIVKIPQKGKINSFNASVAAGIVLYEILKQRLQ